MFESAAVRYGYLAGVLIVYVSVFLFLLFFLLVVLDPRRLHIVRKAE